MDPQRKGKTAPDPLTFLLYEKQDCSGNKIACKCVCEARIVKQIGLAATRPSKCFVSAQITT